MDSQDKPLRLSPTSFALLGLLRDSPMTASQLTDYMQRSILRLVWPRAVSGIYAEPKRLAQAGLVDVLDSAEHRGALYQINERGTEALSEWVAKEDSAPMAVEAEQLLKVVFSAESTIDDFHRLLDEIARVEVPGEVTRVMERFRDGRFEFPDRVHLTAAVWLLQANMIRALVDWARWLRAESGDWIDLHPSEEKSSWATEVLTEVADTLAAWDERQNDESASLS